MLTSSTVIKMNWIAILVLLVAVINDCSARNNLTIESRLKVPCDHELPKNTFTMNRLFPPEENEAPMFTELRKLQESLKKLPAEESRLNMTHFLTVSKTELGEAISKTKQKNSAERGLKAVQIMLYKFYIKLDKILYIRETDKERAVEGNLLALLCLFLQTGVNSTVGHVATLLQQQRNVTKDDIEFHRNTFKLELICLTCQFNKSLSQLARKEKKKVKKNVKQKNGNVAKQIEKSRTKNKETGEADEYVTNGRITKIRNKRGKGKRTKGKNNSKNKRRKRGRNKGRKNKSKKDRKVRKVRKNKQNSCSRVCKILRKGKGKKKSQ